MQIRSTPKITCTHCPRLIEAVALGWPLSLCGLVLCPQLCYSSAFLSHTTPLLALTRDPSRAGVPGV